MDLDDKYDQDKVNGQTMTRPHVCPVCHGMGLVVGGFYSMAGSPMLNLPPQMCRTCEGKGVIFQDDEVETIFIKNV